MTIKYRKKIAFKVICNAGIFLGEMIDMFPDLTKTLMLDYFLGTFTLLKQDLSPLLNYNPN